MIGLYWVETAIQQEIYRFDIFHDIPSTKYQFIYFMVVFSTFILTEKASSSCNVYYSTFIEELQQFASGGLPV